MSDGSIVKRVYRFYADGFRSMTVGKRLWVIILVKLAVIFLVFRIFFFQDFLGQRFDDPKQKGDYVINELTKHAD